MYFCEVVHLSSVWGFLQLLIGLFCLLVFTLVHINVTDMIYGEPSAGCVGALSYILITTSVTWEHWTDLCGEECLWDLVFIIHWALPCVCAHSLNHCPCSELRKSQQLSVLCGCWTLTVLHIWMMDFTCKGPKTCKSSLGFCVSSNWTWVLLKELWYEIIPASLEAH